jgi:hypothetical protein
MKSCGSPGKPGNSRELHFSGRSEGILEDLPPEKILESAERVRQFLLQIVPEPESECHRAMQSGLIQTLLGCRMMEGQLPERFERGFEWAEEGLFRLGPIFKNCPEPDRDWNLVFMMNRLYKQWARFAPAYPEASIAWYGERLSKSGLPNPLDALCPSPKPTSGLRKIISPSPRLDGRKHPFGAKGLVAPKTGVSGGWMGQGSKTGNLARRVFGQNRVLERWKRIQALADIVILERGIQPVQANPPASGSAKADEICLPCGIHLEASTINIFRGRISTGSTVSDRTGKTRAAPPLISPDPPRGKAIFI